MCYALLCPCFAPEKVRLECLTMPNHVDGCFHVHSAAVCKDRIRTSSPLGSLQGQLEEGDMHGAVYAVPPSDREAGANPRATSNLVAIDGFFKLFFP